MSRIRWYQAGFMLLLGSIHFVLLRLRRPVTPAAVILKDDLLCQSSTLRHGRRIDGFHSIGRARVANLGS